MVHQLERGEENGVLHVQGYVYFKEPRTMATVKRLLGYDSAHLEPRRGSHTQAKDYCMKLDTRVAGPWEFGDSAAVPEFQGDNGWGELLCDARTMREVEMFEKYPERMIRCYKGINRFRQLCTPSRNWPMRVCVLVGPSGVGKTYTAHKLAEGKTHYVVPEPKQSGLYMDGYEGQEVVIVDEMSKRFFTRCGLLRLLDRYAMKVSVHGNQVEFTSRIIIFTSNKHPKEWYNSGYDWEDDPLRRRLTENGNKVWHMRGVGELYIKDPVLDAQWKPEAEMERIARVLEEGARDNPIILE